MRPTIVGLIAFAVMSGGVVAVQGPAAAEVLNVPHPTPSTALTIASLPYLGVSAGDAQGATPDPGNTAVANACNGGNTVYSPAWWTFTAPAAMTVLVRAGQYSYTGDSISYYPVKAALRRGNSQFVCGAAAATDVTNVGPVTINAGETISLVKFNADPTTDSGGFLQLLQTQYVTAPNDAFTTPSVIAALPTTGIVDPSSTIGTYESSANPCSFGYDSEYAPNPGAWFRYAPATDQAIRISITRSYPSGYQTLMAATPYVGMYDISGPDAPGTCSFSSPDTNGETQLGRPIQLLGGHTYLFMVTQGDVLLPGPVLVRFDRSTPPSAPQAVSALASAGSVAVSWASPASDGGWPITSYGVSASPGGAGCTVTVSTGDEPLTCSVGGLSNGVDYSFSVAAKTVAGVGAAATVVGRPRTVPSAPGSVTADPGDGSASVSWAVPASDGGAPITGYSVTASPGGSSCSTTVGVTPNPLSCVVGGLSNGTSYTLAVRAVNVAGSGAAGSTSATPRTVPSAPQNLAAVPGNSSVTASWSAPSSSGGAAVTGYTVTASPGGAACSTTVGVTPNPLSCAISGLTNGTTYVLSARAHNPAGTGSATTASAVPRTVPSTPTSVTAVAGDGSATVSWGAPTSDGGAAVSGYTVTASPGGANCSTTVGVTPNPLACVVGGLSNGTTYTFAIRASNAAGLGAPASTSATPRTLPSAPQNVQAVPADGAVTVSWSAPATDGGAAITGYTVTASPGGLSCATTVGSTPDPLTCAVSGLTNGTAYTLSVRAVTDVGAGAIATKTATPRTVPSSPLSVSAVAGDGSVSVSWSEPSSDGGASVTGYTVSTSPGGATCTTTVGVTTDPLRCVVGGLANGRQVTVSVRATNVAGSSAPSSAIMLWTIVPGIDLTGVDLRTADLSGLPMRGVVLVGANLVGAHVDGADLSGADLTGADLTGADASEAKFIDAKLTGAILTGSDLRRADLTGAVLNGVLSTGAKWSGAVCPDGFKSEAHVGGTCLGVKDAVPPKSVLTAPSATFVTSTAVKVSWTGNDTETGVDAYDVRWSRTPAGGGASSGWLTWKSSTVQRQGIFTGSAGYTYCFSSRAYDLAGNVSLWSTARCTTVPFDNLSLKRNGKWATLRGSEYFGGSATRSSQKGASLTRPSLDVRQVALVATTCTNCGSVAVYVGKTRIGVIDLRRSSTTSRRLVSLPRLAKVLRGPVKVVVLVKGRAVTIDAVAVTSR